MALIIVRKSASRTDDGHHHHHHHHQIAQLSHSINAMTVINMIMLPCRQIEPPAHWLRSPTRLMGFNKQGIKPQQQLIGNLSSLPDASVSQHLCWHPNTQPTGIDQD
jgi:hypothetical protein